jgi:hypothetical protein
MSMSKKDFIGLADIVKDIGNMTDWQDEGNAVISEFELRLCDYFKMTNERFKEDRWLSYIAGTCGKNGGKVKK